MDDASRGRGGLFSSLASLVSKFTRGPEVTDTVTRTFTVGAGARVVAHNPIGTLKVHGDGSGAVAVEVVKKGRGEITQQDLERIHVNCTQDGDLITVDVVMDHHLSLDRQMWADLNLTVPTSVNLDLRLEAGALEVHDTRGTLAARVDAGSIQAEGVNLSGSSRANVDAGQIQIAGELVGGTTLDVRVDAGRIKLTLPQATPARLEASTDVGAINISGWNIPVLRNITSARAAGDLGPNPSGSLTAHVDMGEISISVG